MHGKKSRFDSIKKEFRSLSERIEAQDTKSDQYLNNNKEQSAASKDRESTENREVSRDLDKDDDDDDDDDDKDNDNLAKDDNDGDEHANEKRTDCKAKVIAKFKKYMIWIYIGLIKK